MSNNNISKRRKEIEKDHDKLNRIAMNEAFEIVKKRATAKFDESIDVAICLGISAKQSEQNVRLAVKMPSGTGKVVRVAVFADGDKAEAAKAAGADIVGFEDLAESIQQGNMDFDVVIASPDAMRVVGKLGQILGPRGLMPNPKVGTVTADVVSAVKEAKAGQVRCRNDKNGIIHASIGKASFTPEQLKANLMALLTGLKKAKPASAKGIYFKKVIVSSTMGISQLVDLSGETI